MSFHAYKWRPRGEEQNVEFGGATVVVLPSSRGVRHTARLGGAVVS